MKQHLDRQCINMLKVAEDATSADYLFYCAVYVPDIERSKQRKKPRNRQHQTNFGRVKIYKAKYAFKLIYAMPDDTDNKRTRATIDRLLLHWQEGQFPQRTIWASG